MQSMTGIAGTYEDTPCRSWAPRQREQRRLNGRLVPLIRTYVTYVRTYVDHGCVSNIANVDTYVRAEHSAEGGSLTACETSLFLYRSICRTVSLRRRLSTFLPSSFLRQDFTATLAIQCPHQITPLSR